MEVILLKDVEKVGLRGDVVNVARGYMRNYLEPRKLAETATPALLAEHQKREANRARHEARTLEQAQEIATKLGGIELRFERSAGPRGRLFGSVTPTDIADEIWSTQKVRVDRRKIDLDETIKRVGVHTVPIRIFEDVSTEVRTVVTPEGGELPSEDEIAAWEAEERAEVELEEGEVEGAEELEALLAEEEPEPVAEAAEGEESEAAEGVESESESEEPAAEAAEAEAEPAVAESEPEEAEATEPEAEEAPSEEPAAEPAEESQPS
ncbi:MAG: 50S ribosomal protein L9 [Planctomycetota bacterium]